MNTKPYILGLAALSVFALSACGMLDPNRAARNRSAAAPASTAPAGPPPSASPVAAGPTIKVATTDLGEIVTTGKGATLYLFTKDTTKPVKPTCYGACATKWPAYPYSESLTVVGIDKALVGKVQRTDGTWQLTINNWPTYTYAPDKPGETNGQGLGQTWFAITPQGKKAAGSTGGGY